MMNKVKTVPVGYVAKTVPVSCITKWMLASAVFGIAGFFSWKFSHLNFAITFFSAAGVCGIGMLACLFDVLEASMKISAEILSSLRQIQKAMQQSRSDA